MFTPEQTKIFKYFDGKKLQGVDPLDIQLKFSKSKVDWDDLSFRAQAGETDAIEEIVNSFRSILGLHVYDAETDTGLTSMKVLETFQQFGEYMAELKKNTEFATESSPSKEDSPSTPMNASSVAT